MINKNPTTLHHNNNNQLNF